MERYDMLEALVPGGVFLLNSPFGKEEIWEHLPQQSAGTAHRKASEVLRDRRLPGARETGMGRA